MKYLFLLLMILGLCACGDSKGGTSGSATVALLAPVDPTYTFRVIGNSNVAGDIYTDFGLSSQVETGTGVVSVPASQDFSFHGKNTLAQWKLISGAGFEVKFYRNGVQVDDQTVTVVGQSVTLRADL